MLAVTFGAAARALSGLEQAAILAAGVLVALVGWTVTSRDRTIPAVVTVAFLVRALCALATELHPVFPDYYYGDARKYEGLASVLLAHWQGGTGAPTGESCDHMNYIRFVAGVYWLFGEEPAVVKVVNSLVGSLVPGAFAALGAAMFGGRAGALAGWLIALWPSAVFWSSQNFRESLVALGVVVVLLGVTLWLRRAGWWFLALAGAGLVLVGLFRSYGLVILLLAMACALVASGRRGRVGLRNAALGLALAAVLVLVPPGNPLCLPSLRGATPDEVSSIRGDLIEANMNVRKVGTALVNGRGYTGWVDMVTDLPRMAFWVAFMPLPGSYPLEGRLGRVAASVENLLLLSLSTMGLVGLLLALPDPAGRYLALVLGGFLAAYALVEPDLGSAMRHKPLYMAIMVLFAAHVLDRLYERRS